jgi:hypothetical protein
MLAMLFNGVSLGVLIGAQIARGQGKKLRLEALRKARRIYLRRIEKAERPTAQNQGNKS